MNKAIILGRIGQDPQITNLDSGMKIAKFTVATNETYKNKAGEKVQETDWHNVEVFGKLAEIAEKYFQKGKQILVEGRIKTDTWEKEGQKHYRTKIVMNGFEFIQEGQSEKPNPKPEDYKGEPTGSLGNNDDDDELPF